MPSEKLRDLASSCGVDEHELLTHLSFTFAVEGISRACSHQLVRHRLASFSQKSQRYVQVKKLEEHVVVPKTIEERAPQIFSGFIEAASGFYRELLDNGVPKEVGDKGDCGRDAEDGPLRRARSLRRGRTLLLSARMLS